MTDPYAPEPSPDDDGQTAISADPLIGVKLGDYVVEEAVGWGGMGIVYRAIHPLIGRKVAVKVLRPEIAADQEQASRFLKEAKALSAIKHRGIIDIISFGTVPDGRQYMVMEFLEGESLEATLKHEGVLTPARALALLEEIIDALSAAHRAGVVHRDLKPANVFVSLESNGTRYLKLVDFGLAHRSLLTDLHDRSAAVGEKASIRAGTPEYLSPEQADGSQVTPRTDLYSLGVMLFEMVTGELPFQSDSVVGLMQMHLSTPAPRARSIASNLPEALDDLIAQLLEKDPEARPRSADSLRQPVQRMIRQLREESTQIGVPLPTAPEPSSMKTMAVEPIETADPVREPLATRHLAPLPSVELPAGARSRTPMIVAAVIALAVLGALLGWWLRPSPVAIPEAQVQPELPPPPALKPPAPLPDPTPVKPIEPVLAGNTEPIKADPVKPVVVKKYEPLPEVCELPDWKAQLRAWSGRMEQAFMSRQPEDRSPLTISHAFFPQITAAKSDRECAAIARKMSEWEKKYAKR